MILSKVVDYPHNDWKKVNKEGKAFVEYLLQHDLNKRPSAAEALQHPWLQQVKENEDQD